MQKIKSIMLTTDFSDAARMAYPFAARIAEKFNAKIYLVHFANSTAEKYSGVANDEHIMFILQSLKAEKKRDEFSGISISAHRLDRRVSKSLPRFEDEFGSDLVVTAVRRRKWLEHFFLNDIGEEVLAASTKPVLAYTGSNHATVVGEIKQVLMPIFSETALSELAENMRFLQKHFQAKFQLLEVEPPLEKKTNWFMRLVSGAHTMTSSIETRFVEMKETELSDVDVTFVRGNGVPAEVIATQAEKIQADLIVVLPLGIRPGVAKRLATQANCSVLKLPIAVDEFGH